MNENKPTIGLMVERVSRYGSVYVEARVMVREPGREYPRNMSYDPLNDATLGAGVTLSGYISLAYSMNRPPEYCSTGVTCAGTNLDLRQARAFVAILGKIERQIAKDHAYENGDVFNAFATALGARFIVTPVRTNEVKGGSWSDTKWLWYEVASARNVYREVIAEALHAVAREQAAAAA